MNFFFRNREAKSPNPSLIIICYLLLTIDDFMYKFVILQYANELILAIIHYAFCCMVYFCSIILKQKDTKQTLILVNSMKPFNLAVAFD